FDDHRAICEVLYPYEKRTSVALVDDAVGDQQLTASERAAASGDEAPPAIWQLDTAAAWHVDEGVPGDGGLSAGVQVESGIAWVLPVGEQVGSAQLLI